MPKGDYERSKTHCVRGHAYDEKNTRFNGDGSRHCRTCDSEKKKRARRAGGKVIVPFKERTHCPRGHAYDEANTRWRPEGRTCRACDLEKQIAKAIENPERVIWATARARAGRRGLEFDIEVADIVIPDRCPALGIPIVRNTGKLGASDSSPSLDRIDSNAGYVRGNIIVLSWRANRIKNNGTAEEHDRIAAWMRSCSKD